MYYLVYVSSATVQFTPTELHELLEQSRVKNARLGITGMLLYKAGNFMQIIEGEEAAVKELYATISRDERHDGIMTMVARHTDERFFPDWTMGFRDLDTPEIAAVPGYSEFLNTPLTGEEFSAEPNRCQKLLLMFKENIR